MTKTKTGTKTGTVDEHALYERALREIRARAQHQRLLPLPFEDQVAALQEELLAIEILAASALSQRQLHPLVR